MEEKFEEPFPAGVHGAGNWRAMTTAAARAPGYYGGSFLDHP
jgi:hypothetical protein